MDPIIGGIVSYLLASLLAGLSVNQAIQNNLAKLPGKGDLIVIVSWALASLIFPGYWFFFLLLWSLLIIGCSMAIKKGWWRVVLLVPIFAGFIIFGGLNLPVFWW